MSDVDYVKISQAMTTELARALKKAGFDVKVLKGSLNVDTWQFSDAEEPDISQSWHGESPSSVRAYLGLFRWVDFMAACTRFVMPQGYKVADFADPKCCDKVVDLTKMLKEQYGS